MSEDDRRRGLTFRGSGGFRGEEGGALRLHRDVVATPMGNIPAADMQTYDEMSAAIQALNVLANSMIRLVNINDDTRRLVRRTRDLALDLQDEIERRIKT